MNEETGSWIHSSLSTQRRLKSITRETFTELFDDIHMTDMQEDTNTSSLRYALYESIASQRVSRVMDSFQPSSTKPRGQEVHYLDF